MAQRAKNRAQSLRVTKRVRQRIERGGERLWRFDDFRNLPFSAVAKALSRLTRDGTIERLSKGIYYRTRQTAFGKSRPNPATIRQLVTRHKTVFPSGIAAANLLGFTTQIARRSEVSTTALSLPKKLIGDDTLVHTRRPETWNDLSETDAALLDFLRNCAHFSELSQDKTIQRILSLLSQQGRLGRLLKVVDSEPPRVRAMLGALAQRLGKNEGAVHRLRASLNPLSRFDFGMLAALPNAIAWQAKKSRSKEADVRVS